MTARQLYDGLLVALSKVNAPSVLLTEFNHNANKAITQCLNKQYNIYDTTQQTTDYLRVLTGTAILEATPSNQYSSLAGKSFNAIYEISLPEDYLHILNCICIYSKNKDKFKCNNNEEFVEFAAKKLTADAWPLVMRNYYHKPSPKRPYYYIHNVDTKQNDNKTNPTIQQQSNVISLNKSFVDREAGKRYGNPSEVKCEIRCGDSSKYVLKRVFVEYLKTPQTIILTQSQLDKVEDTSQILEFPDYVCQEILNELVNIFLEKTSDPRLSTYNAVSQSIPVTQQTQQGK